MLKVAIDDILCYRMREMPVTVIEGAQRGDEGKGRFADMLAEEHDIVARYGGCPNAGHTIVLPDGEKFKFHGLPSGFANEHVVNVIGRGALVHASRLVAEIEGLEERGIEVTPENLKLCSATGIILPQHVSAEEIRAGGRAAQGTTKTGIGPPAPDRSPRKD